MNTISITQANWGTTQTGKPASIYTFKHPSGMQARISNYGAALISLHVPAVDGTLKDVVLGYDNLTDYEQNNPYLGVVVGRIAGRLTGATFTENEECYQLNKNEGANHLHGGSNSLSHNIWEAEVVDDTLELSYLSPAKSGGYPGNVHISVSYRITDKMELEISYFAKTDALTPLSLTNHSYFNLAGEGGPSVLNQRVQILADEYVPSLEDGTLTNERMAVVSGGNDLREISVLGDNIDRIDRQHGDNYILRSYDPSKKTPRLAARLLASDNSLGMNVMTTEACLQFYTSRYMDEGVIGKNQKPYPVYSGLCFECQGYPNQPNARDFPSIFIKPDENYRQKTVYQFFVPE
ncbi:MAG: aldose epimerase family protein [Akkermansiaceae bacterium]